jgi:hypothetical protein
MLHAPINIMHHFSVTPITCAHFCVTRQYPLRKVLVLAILPVACTFLSFVDIMHAFHSTLYTMPNFSMPPPRTNTLRAPLTKLSRDNIYPHCTHNNQTPLRYANNGYTTCTIIMCVNIVHTIFCVCTPHNLKFSTHTRTPTFFRAAPKFSSRTLTPIIFRAVLDF